MKYFIEFEEIADWPVDIIEYNEHNFDTRWIDNSGRLIESAGGRIVWSEEDGKVTVIWQRTS